MSVLANLSTAHIITLFFYEYNYNCLKKLGENLELVENKNLICEKNLNFPKLEKQLFGDY